MTELRSEKFEWFGPSPIEPFNSGSIGFSRTDVAYRGGAGMCPETHRYAYSGWETDRGRCCKFQVDPGSSRCEDASKDPTDYAPTGAQGVLALVERFDIEPFSDFSNRILANILRLQRCRRMQIL